MKRSKNQNKRISKSARFTEKRKFSQANQDMENLNTNLDVLTSVCRLVEQSTQGRKVFERIMNLIGKSGGFSGQEGGLNRLC